MSAPLTIEVVHTPEECVVILTGEVDMAAQQTVYADVVNALNECPDDSPSIVIDLAGVTFLDSSGLGALVDIRRQALERGKTIALRAPGATVLRVLQVARLDTLFPIGPS